MMPGAVAVADLTARLAAVLGAAMRPSGDVEPVRIARTVAHLVADGAEFTPTLRPALNEIARRLVEADAEFALGQLLGAGLEPGAQTAQGRTLLTHAVTFVASRCLDRLMAAGADPDDPGGDTTPLLEAVKLGDRVVMRKLLLYGADANGCACGATPLRLAVSRGDRLAVRMLLQHRASPEYATLVDPTFDPARFAHLVTASAGAHP
jgi:ankyrin repeat protein